ncbi:Mov34/MPN/PAD-1 family protein [Dictyostelium purpureum]|uniref:Mov34/MPN/PAD-1 family protein n=1 Tax=Dictyostelium purpureum TaxID=5786 RepID=F0ZXH4_DICPU|nr:Mov34/MPN/PAD-1 family protein [Dictyostelium purpureum]EGC31350.1 Mov34/MPN/PAD-1 family protein [Dictyostelium purpureum]|eukprot:XP_003292126.1 Mov34/MPN/PAD-1 family protein [Dictyostelium purpureum]
MSKGSADALKRFELENNVQTIDHDSLFKYDAQQYQQFLSSKPWAKDPHYFKHVKISAIALLKMVMHARSGGKLEVMGMLMGKVENNTMIIMDSFALPVEGTETRVNAQVEAYEYMVEYLELIKQTGRLENALGWYHSHPGYGCWLSGIDVGTQLVNQQYSEPWLGIVIDPTRTVSAGKVEIGAFRTYPQGYKPPNEGPSEYQSIPLSKIEDFGVHCKQYYSLEISYFKSSLDQQLLDKLWNKYWVNTLSSSPIFSNREYITGQINDLSEKLEQAETQLSNTRSAALSDKKKEESLLSKISKDSSKVTIEQVQGIMSQVFKNSIFNESQAVSK